MKSLLSLLPLCLLSLLPSSHAGSVICTPSPLELVFAVDVSSSLSRDDFAKLKTFMKSMGESLPIGPKQTRPALISFSTNVKVESNLGDTNNLATFKKAVNDIPYYRGFTATGMALQVSRKQVFVKSRTGASKLLVVVTDGRTNHPGSRLQALKLLRKESAKLRSANVRIHAVGIGGVWLKDELKEISGSDDYSMVNDFGGLESLVKKLVQEICEVQCPDAGKVVTIAGRCYYGTQRVTYVSKKRNEKKKRCEKVIRHEYKYCGKSHLCKDISTKIGSCVNGEREVVTSWEAFNVITQRCEVKQSSKMKDCSAIEVCREPVADIVFVLDSSNSIKNRDWNLLTQFTRTLVETLRIGANQIRVGVVIFGHNTVVRIPLGSVNGRDQLADKVGSLRRLSRQNTATGKGLQAAMQQFSQHGRPHVQQVTIVMADGHTNRGPPAIQEAAKLENAGVTVLVVGVGNGVNHNELQGVASPSHIDHLFYPETFNRLVDWAGHISRKICESITPPEPSLCDLPAQRILSPCYKSKQKITELRYEYDSRGMCTKKMVSRVTNKCESACLDPINGNEYQYGEQWQNQCASFTCKRLPSQASPLLPDRVGCQAANGTCYSPGSDATFGCHDEKGKLFSRCQCVSPAGLLVVTQGAP